MDELGSWNTHKSESLYGVKNWGSDYFAVNNSGHITVSPNGPGQGPSLDLFELVQSVTARDIDLPVLLRFNGILRHRITKIYDAFVDAIEEHDYKGTYFPTYPLKVNQQRQVVDVIRQINSKSLSKPIPMGIEVGSKPELIAVMAQKTDSPGLLLCNGYKDYDYVELALMSQKIGKKPIVILEKLSELDLVLQISKKLTLEPEIGLRLKLSEKGSGKWERSGGDRAKFGLGVNDILHCLEKLEERQLLGTVKLLHFHIGSQLTSISSLRNALKESGQMYVQICKRCPNLKFLDVGGGLGVDYDGSKTSFASSMNYTVEEYARDVIWIIGEICEQAQVPQPDIVTESGRATVAHQSVLVFNVLGTTTTRPSSCDPQDIIESSNNNCIQSMAQLLQELTAKNAHETLHDVVGLRADMLQQFNLGLMSIEDRALGDRCYWSLLHEISKCSKELHYIPEDLERLPDMLTDTYYCNFSVFQSLPDSWAIQHIFPIMPIHRLEEEPTRPGILADITCDSDGHISRFADLRDVKRYLPLHPVKNESPYYLATFLVGAYQEILGDLHNLFGDTNAVHVEVTEDGKAEITDVILGDEVSDVLHYVQYSKSDLCQKWRSALEHAVTRGLIGASQSGEMFKKYERAFQGYTYFISSGKE